MLGRPALRSAGSRTVPLATFALQTRVTGSQPTCIMHGPLATYDLRPRIPLRFLYPGLVRFSSTTPLTAIWWRACQSSEEFARRAGWFEDDAAAFCQAYPTSTRAAWRNGGQFLDIAANEIGAAICHENPAFNWTDWRNIVYTKPGFEDMLVGLLIEVWPHREAPEMAFNVVNSLLRMDEKMGDRDVMKSLRKALEDAFEQEQRPSIWDELPSVSLDASIVECHKNHKHNPTRFAAPVTTLIGPEGSGKSYAVMQLGITQGMWVGYSSFTGGSSEFFPRRTPIADMLTNAREDMWISYLIFQILVNQAVSTSRISAAGLARIQYHQDLRDLRRKLATCFALMAQDFRIRPFDDPTLGLENRYPAQLSQIRDIVMGARDLLDERGWNIPAISKSTAGRHHRSLRHVIVLDDVRAANGGLSEASIAALYRAAQALFLNLPNTDPFFVLLVDSASRALDIPMQATDFVHGNAHPPLYRLQNFDVYSHGCLHLKALKNPDGSQATAAPLFRHGRPLWGALLDSSQTANVSDVVHLASKMLEWRGSGQPSRAYHLALLRTRINFHLASPHVHEELAVDWMNYTVMANNRRDHIDTTQPSEPVLAYTASQHLMVPHTRLAAVQALLDGVHDRNVLVNSSEETTAGLMLLFAQDRLMSPTSMLPKAVPVMDFISGILGAEILQNEKQLARCMNVVRMARIFFNHFVSSTKPLTEDQLRAAYMRGAAFYAPRDLPGGGFIIPICVEGGLSMSALHVRTGQRVPGKTESLDPCLSHGGSLEFLKNISIITLHMDFDPLPPRPPLVVFPEPAPQPVPQPSPDEIIGEEEVTLVPPPPPAPKPKPKPKKQPPPPAESRIRLRTYNMRDNIAVYDLHLYVPGLTPDLYPFLKTPIIDPLTSKSPTPTTVLKESATKMTDAAVVAALRKLALADSASEKAIHRDRFAGPLVDFAARVHAMALRGVRISEADEREAMRVRAEEISAAVIAQRRENKRMRKEKMRVLKALMEQMSTQREREGEVDTSKITF